MDELTWISAFLLGLMGAPHCSAMCGGIVGALSLGTQPATPKKSRNIPYVLMYNLGRLVSYTLAGMMAGGVSALSSHFVDLNHLQLILKGFASIFMLFLGLYLGGWWPVLTRLEKVGSRIWVYLEPVGRRFIPIRNLRSAFVLGGIWGWLPCGLVYTALIYSTTAGGAVQGGTLMLSFGLGTLPAMISLGAAGIGLQTFLRQPVCRKLAGITVIGFGVYMAYTIYL